MIEKTVVTLAVVLVLGLAGCSGQNDDHGATPSGSTAATASPDDVEGTRSVCLFVNDAASTQLLDESLAVGGGAKGPAVRAGVASAYDRFARRLAQLALEAPAELRSALTEWAGASTEVARFVAGTEPRPGLVVDYGPAQPRWDAARKTTEEVCGRKLPDTG